MSTSTQEAIRGWEAVDRVWVEEAQRMSERSREILYPTIRKPGSEIWMTFNPRYRHDPVYRDFVARRRDGAWVRRVNFADNPWLPEEAEAERVACLRDEASRYAHIWLGEPDDEGEARKVLPYALARLCVDAWPDRAPLGPVQAGLDVADTGADRNALVLRRGPCVLSVEQWSAGTLGDTARKAHARCAHETAAVLYYDVGGIGAGIRSHLAEIRTRAYAARPINFGSAPEGATRSYTRSMTNADFFARRSSQLGWALRLRAQRTQRLMDGEPVDPDSCLFVSPRLPRLDEYLAQLAQPEVDEDASGRMTLDKRPEDAPSPDMYDATALAFAGDSRYGLRNPS